ncbi:hypothetical protein [Streptomyces celluloflavus]|uniref:hypothetical protein n=1 Tax=Streptomyces celluloflavus TaxID=58344 RepID=UPI0036C3F787
MYQAVGDQYIFHAHSAEVDGAHKELTRGVTVEETHERVTLLIQVLRITEADWRARCAELAKEAQRARAEGRAEALAEVQERLRESELRVMKAQKMMREAQEERRKTETLLLQAHQEAAQLRQAEERKRQEEQQAYAGSGARERARTEDLSREGEAFSQIMEQAEVQLASVRDELRSLSKDVTEQRPQPDWSIIKGEAVQPHQADIQGAMSASSESSTYELHPRPSQDELSPVPGFAQQATSGPARGKRSVPGPPRRMRIACFWAMRTIPPCVPSVVVTALRAAYGADPGVWQAVLFTIGAVLAGALAYLISALLTLGFAATFMTRDSESSPALLGLTVVVLGALAAIIAAIWIPLDWPGPAGAWGQSVAASVGLGQ